MKHFASIILFFIIIGLNSQVLPLELMKPVEKCLVKTHRVISDFELHRTFVTEQKYYTFDEMGRFLEIHHYAGNDAYKGYTSYIYTPNYEEEIYRSLHNVVTSKTKKTFLNKRGDYKKTHYGWGGVISHMEISRYDPVNNDIATDYINDAGYVYYSDLEVKHPDGRVKVLISNDYDGFPVNYDYYYYDDNKRLLSQKKVNYLDSLLAVIDYNYDNEGFLISKISKDYTNNLSTIEEYYYDVLGRLSEIEISKQSNLFGQKKELIQKQEIFYDNYRIIDEDFHRGDDVDKNLQLALEKRQAPEKKRIEKLKAKEEKRREKIISQRIKKAEKQIRKKIREQEKENQSD